MRNKIFRFTTVIALVMIGNLYATLATGNSVISAHAEKYY
ncbi:acyl-CoA reductase-like NAD-dependent aldehyde dehydrogenase [Clostridium butyricum]|nr:acyl-CoA reductase-like NAD-dependent aldehyde dehydrogenase [Clostridium butyricum]